MISLYRSWPIIIATTIICGDSRNCSCRPFSITQEAACSEVRDADRMKHDDMLGQVQLEKLGLAAW